MTNQEYLKRLRQQQASIVEREDAQRERLERMVAARAAVNRRRRDNRGVVVFSLVALGAGFLAPLTVHVATLAVARLTGSPPPPTRASEPAISSDSEPVVPVLQGSPPDEMGETVADGQNPPGARPAGQPRDGAGRPVTVARPGQRMATMRAKPITADRALPPPASPEHSAHSESAASILSEPPSIVIDSGEASLPPASEPERDASDTPPSDVAVRPPVTFVEDSAVAAEIPEPPKAPTAVERAKKILGYVPEVRLGMMVARWVKSQKREEPASPAESARRDTDGAGLLPTRVR